LVIESEEALDAEVAATENFLIQVGAKFLKIFQAIGHDSSGGHIPVPAPTLPAIMNQLGPSR
jgi:hypothetical protein